MVREELNRAHFQDAVYHYKSLCEKQRLVPDLTVEMAAPATNNASGRQPSIFVNEDLPVETLKMLYVRLRDDPGNLSREKKVIVANKNMDMSDDLMNLADTIELFVACLQRIFEESPNLVVELQTFMGTLKQNRTNAIRDQCKHLGMGVVEIRHCLHKHERNICKVQASLGMLFQWKKRWTAW
jgi:hypothetical protein